jgi:dipeptidyl aminopeptidase/acylaminoacyl peptidase
LGPSGGSEDSRIVIQQLISRERRVLIDKSIFGHYLSNGNLLLANNEGTIFIVPFDLRGLKIKGEPVAVLSGVNTATWSGAAFISVSETGNLIFLPRNIGILNVLNVVDRSGNLINKDSIPMTTLERMGHGWGRISISPSGNQIGITGRSFGSADVWLLNLNTGETERRTFNLSVDESPMWSPNGNSFVYASALTGTARQLFIEDNYRLAAYDYTSTNGTDCYAISVDSDEFISIATSGANESNAEFSPDGKWLAFQSNESGRSEIYIVSFPKLESRRQISEDGGVMPHWDRSGKFIYYICNGFMVAQPVKISHEFAREKPVNLFQTNASEFLLSPDGQKFYLVRGNNKRPNQPLHLITNWFQELKTKTGK